MFRGARQRGFIPVLQSYSASPLELWNTKVQNGSLRRITDEQVRALALEISSTNVSTCYIFCPKDQKISLGIHMPFLVMIIKGMKKYFTFEITILDDCNMHRRFRMSNFQKINRIHHFSTSMPLCLNAGWNEMYFDLDDLTRRAYKTNYVETTKLQIHANCRIRVIYFCDKIYDDTDIPQKFKMFLPNNHICHKKKTDELHKDTPESTQDNEFEAESQLLECAEYKKKENEEEKENDLNECETIIQESIMERRILHEISSIEGEESIIDENENCNM
ncbi:PREDICTED: cilia- and flagella-associated protein 20-like [Ceratosolen solmsi marchali]|uniref:Cilia- and flagella-associated protein 20-like n=1 Tax=Ceratosolen solmsi marchali TaxID=326594 RepID=A0AAJ7DUP9_9HYME|nr:PREDICTED: cilia- and flagella-associated protein 20-like [Ceratosolen solmsi marchali]